MRSFNFVLNGHTGTAYCFPCGIGDAISYNGSITKLADVKDPLLRIAVETARAATQEVTA